MTNDTLRAAAEAAINLVLLYLERGDIGDMPDRQGFAEAARQHCEIAKTLFSQEPPAAAPAQGEPLLLGRWHHGEGFMVCGTMRALRADFDTNPSKEFQGEFFDWVCNTMNASVAQWRSRAALPHPPAEGSQT